MVARIIQACDELLISMNSHAFTMPFIAQRAYRPTFDLRDMDDIKVVVVPKSVEMTMPSRDTHQCEMQIDIGVMKKLASADNAEIDAMIQLVNEIVEYIRTVRLFGDSVWVKTENSPIYSPEHLIEIRQFTSILTLTLRSMSA